MRFWIGFWVMIITFVVIGLEGSFLVKNITRFTEEIFTIVISLIFIYEVVKKMKAVSYLVQDKGSWSIDMGPMIF